MKLLSATALAAGLLSASAAFAQTTPAPTAPSTAAPMTTAPATTAPAATAMPAADGMQMGTAGMTTATSSAMVVRFIGVQPTDTVASRIRGTDIYNNANEKLGEIEDFVIKDGKTISGVILGVGGFLGMGERYVAVEPSAITLVKDGDEFKGMINTNKDALNSAPKFEYKKR